MRILNIVQCRDGFAFDVKSFVVDEEHPEDSVLTIAYKIFEECGNKILQNVRDKGFFIDYEFSDCTSEKEFISHVKRQGNMYHRTIDNSYSVAVLYST